MWYKFKSWFGSVAKKFRPSSWLEKKQTTILSAAVVITLANICNSLSGLLRGRLLTSRYFDTVLSQQQYEAFLVAFQIPDLMYQLIILGAISAAFIPVFTQIKKKRGDQDAFKMTSIVMNILLAIFVIVGAVVFIFAREITVFRTGAEFTPEQIDVVVKLTRVMLFSQLFFAVSNFFTSMLQSFQKFIMPAIAPILYNLGIVAGTYLLYPWLGIYAAGVGVIFGAFLHMAIQWPQIKKLHFKHTWSFDLNFPGVKKIFKLMPPRVLTVAISEIQNLSVAFFTTQIGNLSFIIINYATSIITLPIRFFGVPIAQASLPFLSEQAEESDRQTFRTMLIDGLNQISFLTVPASVLVLILRIPIVRLIYGSRNFPWSTTVSLGRVVAIISVSIAAQAMYQLLLRAFHAIRNTRTPFIISIINLALFFIGCSISTYWLNPDFQIYGIACTLAIIAFIEAALYIIFINRQVGHVIQPKLVYPQLKIVAAGLLMGIALYIPFKLLDQLVFDTTKVVPLIILTGVTAVVGIVVYFFFCWLFKLKELKLIWNVIRNFNKKRAKAVKIEQEPLVVSADMVDEV